VIEAEKNPRSAPLRICRDYLQALEQPLSSTDGVAGSGEMAQELWQGIP